MTATNETDAPAAVMTIGQLSRRSGMSVKALRRYEGMGLIYTVGRSPAGYRLFDEDALWCVRVIGNLRGLGLTVAEIRQLAGIYLAAPEEPIGPHLAGRLRAARSRMDVRIAELRELRRRIDDFEASRQAELTCHDGHGCAGFRGNDPRFTSMSRVWAAAGA